MNKPVLPVSVLTAWAAILDDIAKAAIVGIGNCIRSYLSELEN